MSHVDDGALHAYLDGALDEYPPSEAERIRDHLDRCAECMDRLEGERRIRGDAHAFLDMASPVVEAPSLEELRAYVQRTRPERRGISRIQRLGWAASVVLALGAGWMVRDGQLQTRDLEARRDRGLAPATETAFEASPARAVTDGRAASEEGVPERPVAAAPSAVATAEPPPAAAEEPADGAVADAAAERRTVVAQVVSRGAAAPPAETTRLMPKVVGVERAASESDAVTAAPAVSAPWVDLEWVDTVADAEESLDALSLSANVVAGAEPTTEAADADSPGAGEVVAARMAAGESIATPARASAEDEPATGGRTLEAPPVVTSELQRDVGGSPAARTAAAREADDSAAVALLAVPGHTVISVTNLGNGTTAWGVRVLQEMTDGGTFEVFHLEPAVDPSILPDLATGRNEARLETAEGWIVARGPLSEVELARMLQSLFPQGS